jgi:hypothetical protein
VGQGKKQDRARKASKDRARKDKKQGKCSQNAAEKGK